MLIVKEINDDGIIKLTAEELKQLNTRKVMLIETGLTCNQLTFGKLQKLFEGQTVFASEQELQDYMLSIRKEIRGY